MTGPVVLGRAGRTPLPEQRTESMADRGYDAQRETGDPDIICGDDEFSGPRSRPSGLRFGYSAPGTGSGPVPAPAPDNPYLTPDRLRPETRRCILSF